jgi:hypothetical protein
MEFEWLPVADGAREHERQAAHFRELAETATTAAIKARLLKEAERHDQIARGEPIITDE